jgi:hypothetical protein
MLFRHQQWNVSFNSPWSNEDKLHFIIKDGVSMCDFKKTIDFILLRRSKKKKRLVVSIFPIATGDAFSKLTN